MYCCDYHLKSKQFFQDGFSRWKKVHFFDDAFCTTYLIVAKKRYRRSPVHLLCVEPRSAVRSVAQAEFAMLEETIWDLKDARTLAVYLSLITII